MNSSHRRTGSRATVALLTGLALAASLSACGDDADSDDTARDPATSSSTPSPSEEPTPEPSPPAESGSGAQQTIPATGSAGVTEATLVSATEGGGSVSTMAFALDTDLARADFANQFEGGFADTVSTSASEVAQQAGDATVYGATAAIGCEAPISVAIDAGEAGFEVIAKLPKSTIQCLAPVTFVVLFAVPNA